MKLSSLLKDVEVQNTINFKNINITNLSIRADQITKNGLYFAIKGNNFDGKTFTSQAISCGAKAVVSEEIIENVDIPQIIVPDIRIALSVISRTFFNKADKKMKIIGVVGTNGKTTTSTILYNLLRDSDNSVGLIGTNGVFIDDLSLPNVLTTPDPIELFYTLEQMALLGVKYVVMEISAQAVYYNKVYGICPDYLIFTNITNEHLDFFKTMENYSKVKLDYINSCNSVKVVNIDDKYGNCVLGENVITYGLYNPADVFAIDIELGFDSCKFLCNCMDEIIEIDTHLTGEYNVYNVLGAITVARCIGITTESIKQSLKKMMKVDGRWEIFDFPNNNKVIVDYAHTPDGFEKVLSTVRQFRKGRLITLFGCVGYSDKAKRKMMGDLAKKYSDFVVITTDNLGSSDFDEVVADIGITKYYAKIKNRAKAVDFAIKMLDKNDTLLLLGKGAENYQKTTDGREEYNEIELVKSILCKMTE